MIASSDYEASGKSIVESNTMVPVSQFNRRLVFCLIIALSAFAAVPKACAEGQRHRLVIHVNENSESKYHMVLNIVQAVTKEARSKHDTIEIEIVTHGPGLNMLRLDKSPVKKANWRAGSGARQYPVFCLRQHHGSSRAQRGQRDRNNSGSQKSSLGGLSGARVAGSRLELHKTLNHS